MAEEPRAPEQKAAEHSEEGKPSGEQKAELKPPEPDEAVRDALEEDRFEATDN